MYSHNVGNMFVNPAGNLRDGLDLEQILATGKEYVNQAGSLLEQAKETASNYLPSDYLPGQVQPPATTGAPALPPPVTPPPALPAPVTPPPVVSPATPPVQSVPMFPTTPQQQPLVNTPPAAVLPPGAIIVERRPGLIEKVPPPAAGAVVGAGLWYLTESWMAGLGSAVVVTVLLNRMHKRDRERQQQ